MSLSNVNCQREQRAHSPPGVIFHHHRSPSRVSSSGRSRAAIASRALKIRERTVPIGQFMSWAISS
jgi:hypothetical protein